MRPRFLSGDLWERHERRCLEIIAAALECFAGGGADESEDSLNRRLYRSLSDAARSIELRDDVELPVVVPEGQNPPLESDLQRVAREFKRPDFYWAYHDHDGDELARQFVVECKRLTTASSGWNYTTQYVRAGVIRFVSEEHGYGKAAPAGAMVGYLQRMTHEAALAAVNDELNGTPLPTLQVVDNTSAAYTRLEHALVRSFRETPFRLWHYWLFVSEWGGASEG